MAAVSACSVARPSGPDDTFHEFESAVMSLVHGGCCATPSLSATRPQPAPPTRQNTKFRRLGRDAGSTPYPRATRFCRQFAALSSFRTSPSYTPSDEALIRTQAEPISMADLPPIDPDLQHLSGDSAVQLVAQDEVEQQATVYQAWYTNRMVGPVYHA